MYETWLRSFHAVARHGSVTAAADALGLSQPTVSEQVKALEKKFGVELFHRQGRRITPTSMGQSLYEITQDIAGHMDEAVRLLAAAGREPAGPFAIGSANPYYVMALVNAYMDRFPRIQPSVAVAGRRETIQGLRDFRFDVAMFGRAEPDADILNMPYRRDRIMVLVPADHPWTERKSIRIADLAGQSFVAREARSTARAAIEEALQLAGVETKTVMTLDNREAIRDAVAMGIGLGYVAEGELLPVDRVSAVPISDAKIYIHLHVACLKSRAERPQIKAFLETARKLGNWTG